MNSTERAVREAVWPSPPDARSVVVLGNASDVAIEATVTQPGHVVDTFQLGPYETRTMVRESKQMESRRCCSWPNDGIWFYLCTWQPSEEVYYDQGSQVIRCVGAVRGGRSTHGCGDTSATITQAANRS